MDLLLIGGTRFSGRALAEQALEAGHRVTLFHRGNTGADLLRDRGAEHVLGDRKTDLERLRGRRFDAIVDFVGFVPRVVGASARLLADSGYYAFISSISAHQNGFPPGATEDAPVHEPPFPETEEVTGETYGPLKVACERQVQEVFGERAAILRPGFIVGPHDPSDRFPSLLRRAASGGEMLLPGPADAALQFVDARDLAAFALSLAERRQGGVFNVVHPMRSVRLKDVVQSARQASGADTRFTWVDPKWLQEQLGEEDSAEAFPLWAPDDEAFHLLDASRAQAAGLKSRPLDETVRDTLAWMRSPEGPKPAHGLSSDREASLLAAWRARPASS